MQNRVFVVTDDEFGYGALFMQPDGSWGQFETAKTFDGSDAQRILEDPKNSQKSIYFLPATYVQATRSGNRIRLQTINGV